MPKSRNRKNHKQKLEARRKRINETTNIKQKQMKQWIQMMQESIAKQNAGETGEIQDIIDVAQVDGVGVMQPEEIVTELPTDLGESGELK